MANPLNQSNFINSLVTYERILGFLPEKDQDSFAASCKVTRNLDVAGKAMATILNLKIFSPNNPRRDPSFDTIFPPGTRARSEHIQAENNRLEELRDDTDKTLKQMFPNDNKPYLRLRWKIRLYAKMAEKNCIGNCGELAFLIYEWVKQFFPEIPCDIGCICIPNSKPLVNHAFVVIGDLYSQNAVICDPWTICTYPDTYSLREQFLFTSSQSFEGFLRTDPYDLTKHREYYLIKQARSIDAENKAKNNQQASRPNNGG